MNSNYNVHGNFQLDPTNGYNIEVMRGTRSEQRYIIPEEKDKEPMIYFNVIGIESIQRLGIPVANWGNFKAVVDTYVEKFMQIQPKGER